MAEHPTVGPILFARGCDRRAFQLAALLVTGDREAAPVLIPDGADPVPPVRLDGRFGRIVWRYDFALPARADATYRLGPQVFPVAADLSGDLRIAFVSCNGQENGDLRRPVDERNAMWERLARENASRPFGLLLQGGDQLYADEVLDADPGLRRWWNAPVRDKDRHPYTVAMRETAERFYFERYLALFEQPGIAALCARVPSLMMWDDHDIVDGWGSHPSRTLDSPVGRGLFAAARAAFALFQLARSPDEADAMGGTLGYGAAFPGFTVVAPDLRSERRPDRVMGPAGWAALEGWLATASDGERLLLMSTVPLLGPRLSWVEWLIGALPGIAKYKDDLRDQWQSRSHRAEWRRLLRTLEREAVERGRGVTALSGEIHLATRGEMAFGDGSVLHQLVASGIAHPAPPAGYSAGLGLLAALGEDPLENRPIRLRPLPGRRWIYTGQRNYLVLERTGTAWTACWELEHDGRTPALAL
ncbi:MAG: alkaline phosphatase D family protein [Thalassobaculum sp.]|uniref:alkaline phosphatase D family protein n=1 Tax=Thalassobaculum sp. TaxID=2022740 RepID=UPI0032EF1AF7